MDYGPLRQISAQHRRTRYSNLRNVGPLGGHGRGGWPAFAVVPQCRNRHHRNGPHGRTLVAREEPRPVGSAACRSQVGESSLRGSNPLRRTRRDILSDNHKTNDLGRRGDWRRGKKFCSSSQRQTGIRASLPTPLATTSPVGRLVTSVTGSVSMSASDRSWLAWKAKPFSLRSLDKRPRSSSWANPFVATTTRFGRLHQCRCV